MESEDMCIHAAHFQKANSSLLMAVHMQPADGQVRVHLPRWALWHFRRMLGHHAFG